MSQQREHQRHHVDRDFGRRVARAECELQQGRGGLQPFRARIPSREFPICRHIFPSQLDNRSERIGADGYASFRAGAVCHCAVARSSDTVDRLATKCIKVSHCVRNLNAILQFFGQKQGCPQSEAVCKFLAAAIPQERLKANRSLDRLIAWMIPPPRKSEPLERDIHCPLNIKRKCNIALNPLQCGLIDNRWGFDRTSEIAFMERRRPYLPKFRKRQI